MARDMQKTFSAYVIYETILKDLAIDVKFFFF